MEGAKMGRGWRSVEVTRATGSSPKLTAVCGCRLSHKALQIARRLARHAICMTIGRFGEEVLGSLSK